MEHVLQREGISSFTDAGLQAVLYVADGDMRNALNALQSTFAGFGAITPDTVFKVCDQPHPALVQKVLEHCLKGDVTAARDGLEALVRKGYAESDVVQTVFRVSKSLACDERLKLDFVREIATTHMRVAEGLSSLVQLCGLCARLCRLAKEHKEATSK
ncbi:MAG: hypothetical protein MHM6MM_009248 [Cercozoa sp. M6MM]